MSEIIVTVFGSSAPRPGQPDYDIAHDLGRQIAGRGWTLCNGGYGGTMAAAAEGAASAEGHTIGVTLRRLSRGGGPNPFIRQEVPTFDLFHRLNTLIRLGRGYVILPGGTGTLLELAAVWELMNKSLFRPPRPFVLLGDFWLPLIERIAAQQPDAQAVLLASTPAEACDRLAAAMDV